MRSGTLKVGVSIRGFAATQPAISRVAVRQASGARQASGVRRQASERDANLGVCALDLTDAQQHLVAKLLRCHRFAGALHGLGQYDADVELRRAVAAVLDVLTDVGSIGAGEFVVQKFLEFGLGLRATAVGQFFVPFDTAARFGAASADAAGFAAFTATPLPSAYSDKSPRNSRRPRCSRLITVPTGVFMMSAISW